MVDQWNRNEFGSTNRTWIDGFLGIDPQVSLFVRKVIHDAFLAVHVFAFVFVVVFGSNHVVFVGNIFQTYRAFHHAAADANVVPSLGSDAGIVAVIVNVFLVSSGGFSSLLLLHQFSFLVFDFAILIQNDGYGVVLIALPEQRPVQLLPVLHGHFVQELTGRRYGFSVAQKVVVPQFLLPTLLMPRVQLLEFVNIGLEVQNFSTNFLLKLGGYRSHAERFPYRS